MYCGGDSGCASWSKNSPNAGVCPKIACLQRVVPSSSLDLPVYDANAVVAYCSVKNETESSTLLMLLSKVRYSPPPEPWSRNVCEIQFIIPPFMLSIAIASFQINSQINTERILSHMPTEIPCTCAVFRHSTYPLNTDLIFCNPAKTPVRHIGTGS